MPPYHLIGCSIHLLTPRPRLDLGMHYYRTILGQSMDLVTIGWTYLDINVTNMCLGTDFARSCNAAKLGYVRQSSLRNPSPTMSYYTSVSVRTDKPGVWGTWFATGALPTQCDGYPRFNITTSEDYTLTTTKYSTTTYTLSTDIGNWTYPHLAITRPTCTINPSDCAQLVSDYQSAWDSQDASFAASQQAIVSLANPPSAVVVNGKTSELPLITPAPAITVHGDVYTPLVGASGVTYNLSKAFNYYDDLLLTPGGERTVIYDTMYQLSFRPVPQCSWSDELSFKSSSCSHTAKCTIAAYDVELIYFAPPATSRDLCATTDPLFNRKIVTHYSHPHESVVLNETITLWSDSAYVKYRSISAGRPCQGGQVGATHEGSIVAIPSSDISSMCGWQWTTATGSLPVRITLGVTPYPFNFGDLVGSVPQSAYQCMPECNPWLGTNDCDTIIPSLYSPRLAVPRQVRSIDPAWAECELDWDGSRDPPTAVGSAQVVADPTSVEPTASPPPQTGVAPSRLAQNTSPTTPEPVNGSKPSDPGSNPTKVGPGSGADPSQDDPSDPTDGADPVQNPNPAPPNNDPGKTDAPAQNPPAVTPVPIITIGDSTINNDPTNPGAIILNPSETLSEGDPGTVISGTTISVGPGNNLIIGDSSTVQTIAIPTFNPDNNAGPAPVTLTSINNTPIIITYPDPTSGNDPSAIIIGPSRANNNNNNDNDDGVPLSPGSSTIIDGSRQARLVV
ncbi:hypothetical protein EJ05DRAFT_359820 [Pseudovirgaria hyperparasitica]|uniref:Uncharacterized protein n=1 Tax=Pseudovirgaria hyperparasitica TaxID=470096 RepID=A0A6A6W6W6_9PEZI|nr:uncharacterized protein EJ05DRAFT_359820 [Pseudovirgaria hyperparasitica]KAF2758628.1 hypothetical protein EJ05DRAFT_359820 [Pseudovirgaria hyperparasitica]